MLWWMTKEGRVVEARTRISDGLLDLLIYVTRSDGTFDLPWSQTLSAGEVNELAQRTQQQYAERGWTLHGEAVTRSPGRSAWLAARSSHSRFAGRLRNRS
jgi:hypothetical protein